jgi:hypothetical protein
MIHYLVTLFLQRSFMGKKKFIWLLARKEFGVSKNKTLWSSLKVENCGDGVGLIKCSLACWNHDGQGVWPPIK